MGKSWIYGWLYFISEDLKLENIRNEKVFKDIIIKASVKGKAIRVMAHEMQTRGEINLLRIVYFPECVIRSPGH